MKNLTPIKTLSRLIPASISFMVLCTMLLSIASCDDDEHDTIPPEVSFADITDGDVVWSTIDVTANVTDNGAISKVEFLADGTVFSTITSTPFIATWNTEALSDGEHILKAIATDNANNTSETQVTVVVKNTLVTITVPPDQLWNEGQWAERGFVFLNDEDGNLLASAEFQNGDQIELKSAGFSGETFSLTQVRHSTNETYTGMNFWTFTSVSRGDWVLMREIPDDEDYAGEASLTFINPAPDASYLAVGNGDDVAFVNAFSNEVQSIRLQKAPSKLYVTRSFDSGTPGPGFVLYPNIPAGPVTIDLKEAFTPLTKFDFTLPGDVNYMSIDYHGYADAEFTEHYDLGYTSTTSGTLSVYKPVDAFAAYWSEIEMETGDHYLFSTTISDDPTDFQLIAYQGSVDFSDGRVTYNVTGDDIDLLSTSYYFETNEVTSSWAFVGPASATGSIAVPEIPEAISDFPRPVVDSKPAHFTMYDFGGISGYAAFLDYARNSTYHVDGLYLDGKQATEMSVFQDVASGGRAAKLKHRDLRMTKRHR